MKQIDNYTGGREMSAMEWFELTDIDHAKIKLQKLREETFMRQISKQNDPRHVVYEMLAGIACIAVSILIVLLVIML